MIHKKPATSTTHERVKALIEGSARERDLFRIPDEDARDMAVAVLRGLDACLDADPECLVAFDPERLLNESDPAGALIGEALKKKRFRAMRDWELVDHGLALRQRTGSYEAYLQTLWRHAVAALQQVSHVESARAS